MSFKNNNSCLVCKNKVDFRYINLGNQPLANSYHKGESLNKYPLSVNLCTNCWHSQLTVSVDPKEMFEHYLYVSDTSKTLSDYFKWAKNYILNSFEVKPKNMLEIACNSGLFLEMFKTDGIETLGVDPAQNLRELSLSRNLNVLVEYWNKETSNKIKSTFNKFDLILAFHVLPHVEDPNDFIESCVNVLSDDGKIFIQTSQCDMLLNNEFDVIYHEHSSYFTGRSILQLAKNHGLFVDSIIKTDIHSKSFLFSLTKKKSEEVQIINLINDEIKNGIYEKEKYEQFSKKAEQIKNELTQNLENYRAKGYTLIGYGAAAKGNTLLNYMNYKLDYIIDDNNLKWGYLTPGTNIPIVGIDILKNNYTKICFIPLAWNFYSEIKQRIKNVRDTQNDIFIRYFPNYSEEKN